MPSAAAAEPAVDVARAEHDADLHAAIVDHLELVGDVPDRRGVGPVVERAHEGLARQLDQDRLKTGSALEAHAPTAKRAKRRITTFSPVVPERFARSSSIVLPSYLSALTCDLVEQDDVVHPRLELALGDLRADVLGLVGGLLLEHAQLGVLGVLRDVVLGDVQRRRRGGDVQRDLAGEGLEVVVAGDEVGVAVDLDEHADLAVGVDVGRDGALGGLAAADLQRLVAEADAQQLDGGVDVAVGLGQRLLALHHARARTVAELLDLLGGDGGSGHFSSFVSSVSAVGAAAASAASSATALAARLGRLGRRLGLGGRRPPRRGGGGLGAARPPAAAARLRALGLGRRLDAARRVLGPGVPAAGAAGSVAAWRGAAASADAGALGRGRRGLDGLGDLGLGDVARLALAGLRERGLGLGALGGLGGGLLLVLAAGALLGLALLLRGGLGAGLLLLGAEARRGPAGPRRRSPA